MFHVSNPNDIGLLYRVGNDMQLIESSSKAACQLIDSYVRYRDIRRRMFPQAV